LSTIDGDVIFLNLGYYYSRPSVILLLVVGVSDGLCLASVNLMRFNPKELLRRTKGHIDRINYEA